MKAGWRKQHRALIRLRCMFFQQLLDLARFLADLEAFKVLDFERPPPLKIAWNEEIDDSLGSLLML